jgi:hypothetical protein
MLYIYLPNKVLYLINYVLNHFISVQKMSEKGNDVVNKKYEQHLPKYYMRPTRHDVE